MGGQGQHDNTQMPVTRPAITLLHAALSQEHNVDNVDLVKQLIEEANHRRSVGSTAANADSSRSHSIMQFALKRFIAGGAASRLVSVRGVAQAAGSSRRHCDAGAAYCPLEQECTLQSAACVADALCNSPPSCMSTKLTASSLLNSQAWR